MNIQDDDLNIGGDIFDDFNEDLEESQILEDEQFYRYGRFFAFNIGVGLTTFTGNRGSIYENEPPTFGASFTYFQNFRVAFILGIEFSKHNFVINVTTTNYTEEKPGMIAVKMMRPFFGFRYYMDTSDYGTAITWSNPYFVSRIEYWYQTNKFIDIDEADQAAGGLGFGAGFGLEFPLVLKEYYVGVDFLYHTVNFFDKYTTDYQSKQPGGVSDLVGDVFSVMVTYVINW